MAVKECMQNSLENVNLIDQEVDRKITLKWNSETFIMRIGRGCKCPRIISNAEVRY
jgi:hypothetical protein